MTRRLGGAIAALTILLTIVVTGALGGTAAVARSSAPAAPRRTAFPPTRPTKVLILGDSVMAGAAPDFGPALPGRDVTVDAMVNRTTGQGANVIAQRGADWDVVVILLGYNDGGAPGVYQPAARRILDQLAHVPRVVWLSLHEVRPYYVGVNQFLRNEAAHRPNFEVADWNAQASAHPEDFAGDGLHLRGGGAALLSGFAAQQVVAIEDARTKFVQTLANDRLKARLQAAAKAFATTTTTTPPATTTTTTATDPGVGLIPAETANQDPPPSTTRDRTTTTTDPLAGVDTGTDGCIRRVENGETLSIECSKPGEEVGHGNDRRALGIGLLGFGLVLLAIGVARLRRRRSGKAAAADPETLAEPESGSDLPPKPEA